MLWDCMCLLNAYWGQGSCSLECSRKSKYVLPSRLRPGKIHGFALDSDNYPETIVLAYSENEFSLYTCNLNRKNNGFKLVYEGKTRDWINAATFFSETSKNSGQFVLHMAHSTLIHIKYAFTPNIHFNVSELAQCSDCSILYYSRLYGNSYDELTIFSGNAFGELLVWQPKDALNSKSSMCKTYPLLLRIQAHNGVIHAIDLNLSSQILTTTSDDRSVKYWRVEKLGMRDVRLKPMLSCFGHNSRTMCAIISKIGGFVYIISGGEDSHVCIWSHVGDLLYKRRFHFGAPIWRLGINNNSSILYTTGSTGNIVACNLNSVVKNQNNFAYAFGDINLKNEFIRRIKFVKESIIIGLSNMNRLYYMQISDHFNEAEKWILVNDFPSYKCTVFEVSNDIIATGGLRRIAMYRFKGPRIYEKIFDAERMTGTIRSFIFLNENYFLVADDSGTCVLLKGNNLRLDSYIELWYPRDPCITAGLFISKNYILLGDRKGRVMLYSRSNEKTFSCKKMLNYQEVKFGANFFKLLRLTTFDAYVMFGGHESVIKYIHIGLPECDLKVTQRINMPLSWIEACLGNDIILGFNDNHIVVWSRHYDVLAQMPCGGGHRCWDYFMNNGIINIVFIKQRKVFFYKTSLFNPISKMIKNIKCNTWHIRNCNILRLLKHCEAQTLIVSAGDDNIIKVTCFLDKASNQCAEIHSHVSSVRCLQVYKLQNTENTWIIFSVGGRSQLCISLFNINRFKEFYVHELYTNTLQNMLKNVSQEARLMAIEIAKGALEDCFLLYIAGADGRICQYLWNLQKKTELKFQKVIYLKNCPIKLRFINGLDLLLLTTTSGELYGFNKTLSEKCFQLQLHETGINAIDTYVVEHLLHILSGGDDENIKYTVVNLTNFTVEYKTEFIGLHNTQVNALSIHSPYKWNEKSELLAYTCGIDKQIFEINLKTQKYVRVGFTCIADIKGLEIDNCNRMYLYGSGLQIVCPLKS
nr:uncharacterized protein LOC108118686 isoform X2 [Drosophila bipectinata]